jgi:hypothetical protein
VTFIPPDLPQDDKTPSIGPTPLDESPSVPIARRSFATPRRSYMPTLGNWIMLFKRLSTALGKQITGFP